MKQPYYPGIWRCLILEGGINFTSYPLSNRYLTVLYSCSSKWTPFCFNFPFSMCGILPYSGTKRHDNHRYFVSRLSYRLIPNSCSHLERWFSAVCSIISWSGVGLFWRHTSDCFFIFSIIFIRLWPYRSNSSFVIKLISFISSPVQMLKSNHSLINAYLFYSYSIDISPTKTFIFMNIFIRARMYVFPQVILQTRFFIIRYRAFYRKIHSYKELHIFSPWRLHQSGNGLLTL